MNSADLSDQHMIFQGSLAGATKPPLPVVIAADRNWDCSEKTDRESRAFS